MTRLLIVSSGVSLSNLLIAINKMQSGSDSGPPADPQRAK